MVCDEGALGHLDLPDEDRTGGLEPLDHLGVLGRGRVTERRRAGAGRLARDVAEVLQRDDDAVEGGEGLARGALAIEADGGGESPVGVDRGEGLQAVVEAFDATEEGLDDLDRGELASRLRRA